MRFRHSRVSFAVTLLGPLAAGACAGSGADNEHGPEFVDSGSGGEGSVETGTGEGEAGHDAGQDAASDARAEGGADAALESAAVDAGADALVDGPVGDTTGSETGSTDSGSPCTSTMALLAGGTASVVQSTYGHGVWASATVASGGAASPPSLVELGTGYLGALVGTGAVNDMPLEGTAYAGSWSAPAHIGAALAQGRPALAVAGSTAHLVYWGSDGKFYHGTYVSSWDAASDPVQAGGLAQSFGPSAPVAAAVGSAVVMVQAGDDGVLYDQSWTGSWQAAVPHAGTSVVSTLSPAVVALDGGSADLLVVFVHAGDAASYYLQYTLRSGSSWSTPADVYDQSGNVAYAGTAPSLAALPGGKAILAWEGSTPAYPYVSLYDPATGWTAPMPASSDAVASAPSVARGVCGESAVLAYARSDGSLAVTTMSGGPWTTPQSIGGASGMAWAAVASSP